MAFFCINCKSSIEPKYKACPFCGEPITEFLRRYIEQPIDGKYQILSRLGIGGMGEVYKVLHIHLNSIRVIKLMRASVMTEEGAHERFVREARLATKINHPNVATLYDFSTLEDGSYYMVWEYIEGTNLTELLRGHGCLSPKYAAKVAVQALRGLDAIHRAGVVHRDISPENLMLTRDDDGDERVKIIDLGIAKQWGDAADDKTKTGMFVGKWKYCSPEHLGMLRDGERIDGRADLYSFGIVIYELLTGVPPFLADSPHRYLMLHSTERPRPLVEANPGVRASSELEGTVFRALEKDRNARFQTAREFANTLESLIPSLDDTSATPLAIEVDDVSTEERPCIAPGDTMPAVPLGGDTLSADTIAATTKRSTSLPLSEGAAARTEITIRSAFSDSSTEATIQTASPRVAEKTLDRAGEPSPPTMRDLSSPAKRPVIWFAAAAIVIVVIAAGILMKKPAANDDSMPVGSVVASTMSPPSMSTLAVNAYPWGEVTSIRNLDNGRAFDLGEPLVTPASLELPPGRYEISMMHPKFEPVSKTIHLAPGSQELMMVEFRSADRAKYPELQESLP